MKNEFVEYWFKQKERINNARRIWKGIVKDPVNILAHSVEKIILQHMGNKGNDSVFTLSGQRVSNIFN